MPTPDDLWRQSDMAVVMAIANLVIEPGQGAHTRQIEVQLRTSKHLARRMIMPVVERTTRTRPSTSPRNSFHSAGSPSWLPQPFA